VDTVPDDRPKRGRPSLVDKTPTKASPADLAIDAVIPMRIRREAKQAVAAYEEAVTADERKSPGRVRAGKEYGFAPTVWTEDRLRKLHELYLDRGMSPSDIANSGELDGVTYQQIRDRIKYDRLPSKRKVLEARAVVAAASRKPAEVLSKPVSLADELATTSRASQDQLLDAKAHLERWTRELVSVVDKAILMAKQATSPSGLNAAVQTVLKAKDAFASHYGLDTKNTKPQLTLNFYQRGNPLEKAAKKVTDV